MSGINKINESNTLFFFDNNCSLIAVKGVNVEVSLTSWKLSSVWKSFLGDYYDGDDFNKYICSQKLVL